MAQCGSASQKPGQGPGGRFRKLPLRIAGVIRDYGMNDRAQAPKDSRATHDAH